MKDDSISNFGLLIAYVLPGLVAIWGASTLLPPTNTPCFASDISSTASVGGFLYVTVASVGAGLTASTLRWLVIDTLHHHTGIRPPAFNFAKLSEGVQAFHLLIEIHYRYYQFYANSLVAGLFAFSAWRFASPASPPSLHVLDFAFAGFVALFYAASRDTLKRYYARAGDMLADRVAIPLIYMT